MNYVNLWVICNHYLTAYDPHTHTEFIQKWAIEHKWQHQMKKTEKIKIKIKTEIKSKIEKLDGRSNRGLSCL